MNVSQVGDSSSQLLPKEGKIFWNMPSSYRSRSYLEENLRLLIDGEIFNVGISDVPNYSDFHSNSISCLQVLKDDIRKRFSFCVGAEIFKQVHVRYFFRAHDLRAQNNYLLHVHRRSILFLPYLLSGSPQLEESSCLGH